MFVPRGFWCISCTFWASTTLSIQQITGEEGQIRLSLNGDSVHFRRFGRALLCALLGGSWWLTGTGTSICSPPVKLWSASAILRLVASLQAGGNQRPRLKALWESSFSAARPPEPCGLQLLGDTRTGSFLRVGRKETKHMFGEPLLMWRSLEGPHCR